MKLKLIKSTTLKILELYIDNKAEMFAKQQLTNHDWVKVEDAMDSEFFNKDDPKLYKKDGWYTLSYCSKKKFDILHEEAIFTVLDKLFKLI